MGLKRKFGAGSIFIHDTNVSTQAGALLHVIAAARVARVGEGC
jgi:hypothetical protein